MIKHVRWVRWYIKGKSKVWVQMGEMDQIIQMDQICGEKEGCKDQINQWSQMSQ